MEQVKHAIETGALRPGEQLPGIRPLAEELVINPNTVAKAYRELEHEGVIELRQGAGAFVSDKAPTKKDADKLRAGQAPVAQRDREAARARRDGRRNSAVVRSGTRGRAPKAEGKPVSDRPGDRNSRPVEALRRCRRAARTRLCRCRRDRSSGSSAGTAPARRRRSRCCSGWRGRRRARRVSSACRRRRQRRR